MSKIIISHGWINGGTNPTLPFSDQDTSKEAAESMIGSAGSMRIKVYHAIANSRSGLTDDEIEIQTGMRHQTASARRRELVLSGSIVPSGEKRKTRSGRQAVVHITAKSFNKQQIVMKYD